MASIQQSLNQLFTSAGTLAAVGTGIYTQSDIYKAKQIKRAEAKEDKALEAVAEVDRQIEPTDEEMADYWGRRTANVERGLALRPGDPELLKRYGENKMAYRETIARMEADQQEMAEKKAVQRLDSRQTSIRNMMEALIDRNDIFSAKERGQMSTALNRHLKKGDFK